MKVVSACLAGIKCRYDGRSSPCEKVIELVKNREAIPVCPEQLGGLEIPRVPSEIKGDRVISKEGRDVTAQFEKGAEESLKIALSNNCKEAILKSKSPSCGCGKVYDGTFSGKLIEGDGIFTRLLKKNNFRVITEEDI